MSSAIDKPKAIPWNPWFGVAYVVVVYYISQFISGQIVLIYPGFKHWSNSQIITWLNTSITVQFFYILLAEGLALVALYIFLKRYDANFATIGLRRPHWSDLGWGLASVIPYFGLFIVTVGVISHYVHGLNIEQKQELGFDDVRGTAQLILTFISLVILPPITEEIMVRGFLYSSLKKAMRIVPAAIITSLIFAAAHLGEGGSTGPLFIAAIDTFVLSIVLVYLREKTGGLWASMSLHAVKNGIAFIALFIKHVG